MNVLIAADMEGIAGIDHYGDCLPSHPAAYAAGCALMTDEVLVVIDALRRGGADSIVVGDWHMVGTNVERDRMPDGVEVRPIADLALTATDPSIEGAAGGGPLDAVVLMGHHASTTNPRGFSSHTFMWDMEVLLDGRPLNEVQVYAQGLAAAQIPALVVSGDRWMLEELDDGELGGARLVATKEGAGRARATSYSPAAVRTELAAAVQAALAAPLRPPPPRDYPAELRISVAGEPLAQATVAEPAALLSAIADAFRTSPLAREYGQLATLLPARDGSVARRARRRLGGLLATPVMRSKERSWLASAG